MDSSMLFVGLLLMLLAGVELVRTYFTNTTYNVMKRGSPRVPRGTDPGSFWLCVAVELGLLLLGGYVATGTRIASAWFAALR